MTEGASDGVDETIVGSSIRPITHKEFTLFQGLVGRETGIELGPHKKALVMGRLYGRLRQLGLATFQQYYEQVVGSPDEQVQMLNRISTNETEFFREPAHFSLLEGKIIPHWLEQAEKGRRSRTIRIWSAGCSTGQEPYSIAMSLCAQLPSSEGWRIEILASDLSTEVLQQASHAAWPIEKADQIPRRHLNAFMLKGLRDERGMMKAGPKIRSVIEFYRLNLNEDTYPIEGPFDAIFCRNVLIYFGAESKARVLQRFFDLLTPDGHLFLGHSETLNGVRHPLRSVIPAVYQNVADVDRTARGG